MQLKSRILLSVFIFSGYVLHAQQPFVVVELFTSEGCSNCPPADKALSEIVTDARKNHKPVYALEYHVDYWDYLGWKDIYGKKQFTSRQKNYISDSEEKEVYTPQVFVNGNIALNGSDKSHIVAEIEKALKLLVAQAIQIKLNANSTTDTLLIDYSTNKPDKNFNLAVAVVQRGIISKITKGENAGHTLNHDNVVRSFFIFPLNVQNGTVKIPVNNLSFNKNFSLYAYVQQKQTKKILAATGFDF